MLLTAGILAVVLSACGGNDGATSSIPKADVQVAAVMVRGDALPPMPEDQTSPDAAVGLTMLDVEGVSFDGTPVSITNDGRPKVILFLTHW
jgi:ABC-type Fe3+-hydroxamate transport system substrate-binding protein